MKISEYQYSARLTAVYPPNQNYPAFGLGGEWGELGEKLLDAAVLNLEGAAEIVKEAGDVLWYVANLCSDLDVEMESLAEAGPDADFSKFVDSNAVEPYLAGCGRVGKVLESVKKAIRDDGGVITPVRKATIVEALTQLMRHLVGVLDCFNASLNLVAERNIAKLRDRQQRGVLQGEGDNR